MDYKKILAINLKIMCSTVFSIVITSIIIYFTEFFLMKMAAILVLTFIIQATTDVGLLYLLQRRGESKKEAIKDTAKLQFQRIFLSPIFYIVAVSLQGMFLMHHMNRGIAAFVGYGSALIVTRIIHSIYLIRK